MSLFTKAVNDAIHAKIGIFGWQGSGKTWTASQIAIGLRDFIKSTKPVYFLDTENGSGYVKPALFDAKGVPLMVLKSRAFKDLKPAIEEAEKEASVLILDSISHPWYELTSAYLRNKKDGTKFIRIQDWQIIKDMWRSGYSDPFLTSKLHIIMCGRAANVFQDFEDPEATAQTGKTMFKSVQVGTKMRTESETGYEPSLLCEMEKILDDKNGGTYVRRLSIIKDRFGAMDSHEFDNPTFNDFLPHIKMLNIGGEGGGLDTTRTSSEIFEKDDARDLARVRIEKEKLLEEIEGTLVAAYPSTSAEEKRKKAEFVKAAFGGYSWTALKDASPAKLREGLKAIQEMITADIKKEVKS